MLETTLGLYGKIPAHGDFIDRQLPVGFIRSWDSWLQAALANSRERLGDQWVELYLTGSIWRFVLSSGAIDEQMWAGILMPSVDSVGRYFPLTIAAPLPQGTAAASFLEQNSEWFRHLESIAMAALTDGLNVEQMFTHLTQFPAPNTPRVSISGQSSYFAAHADTSGSAMTRLLDRQLAANYMSISLWQSVFQEPAACNVLLATGMPSVDQFTALIDDNWQHWGWEAI